MTNRHEKVKAFKYDRFRLHFIFAAPFSLESKRTLKVINNISEMLAWEKKPLKHSMLRTGLDSQSWVRVNVLQLCQKTEIWCVVTTRAYVKHHSNPYRNFTLKSCHKSGGCVMETHLLLFRQLLSHQMKNWQLSLFFCIWGIKIILKRDFNNWS